MRGWEGIKFLFFSRGLSRWVNRIRTILNRFSWGPSKQMGIIFAFVDCLKEHHLQGNFFIPAVLLKRYAAELKKVDRQTIEWGIHGLVHTDHSKLNAHEQKTQITQAITVFDQCGFDFKGFRCPYLRFNEHTHEILWGLNRFKFDSSKSVLWEEVYNREQAHYLWIKNFYTAQTYVKNAAQPLMLGSLVEIPVSLPDDDITVDREHYDAETIFRMWAFMLRACHKNNEVFVLQLHPERFLELKDVLNKLIMEAKSLQPSIWMTTLGEVAQWQESNPSGGMPDLYQGAFCISGDIDAITIKDFFLRLQEW